jgi:hypothetical protein
MENIPRLIEAYTKAQADYRVGMYQLDLAMLSLMIEAGTCTSEQAIARFELFLGAMSPEEQEGPKGSAFKGAIQFVRDHLMPRGESGKPSFSVVPGGRGD